MSTPERPPRWDAVLLDLDGTLTDSAPGVTSSVAAALRTIGAEVPDAPTLRRFVGPPLRVGLREIGGLDEASVDQAFHAYREIYRGDGVAQATVFDEIPRLLAALREAGRPVALATSKAVDMATAILERVGLAGYFAVISGAHPDGSGGAKDEVIGRALRGLAEIGHPVDDVVMVGDRSHDVAGAARWGIPCVLVRWGYGDDDEASDAFGVVRSVRELADVLGVRLPEEATR